VDFTKWTRDDLVRLRGQLEAEPESADEARLVVAELQRRETTQPVQHATSLAPPLSVPPSVQPDNAAEPESSDDARLVVAELQRREATQPVQQATPLGPPLSVPPSVQPDNAEAVSKTDNGKTFGAIGTIVFVLVFAWLWLAPSGDNAATVAWKCRTWAGHSLDGNPAIPAGSAAWSDWFGRMVDSCVSDVEDNGTPPDGYGPTDPAYGSGS
jgi:hypothetical protein